MKYWLPKVPLPFINIYDNLNVLKNIFSKKTPIHTENLSCNPFFIVSSGRSGTTLLSIILTKNSEISIPPESQFMHKALRKFKSYRYLGWEELVKIILGELENKSAFQRWDLNLAPIHKKLQKLPKSKRSLSKIIDEIYLHFLKNNFPNASIWGDQSPLYTYYINRIHKIFPNAKYIHLVRDGRAVVNSMLNRNYLNATIKKACKRWNTSISKINIFKNKISNFKLTRIKYENLVRDPKIITKKICKFLGIKFEKSMLKTNENIKDYGKKILSHHENLKKPINDDSVNRWKEELSKKQKKIVYNKLEDNLQMLGYST